MQARITSSGKPWAPLLSAFPDAVWHVPIQEAADYAANDTAVHAHWPGVHAWPWEALRTEHVERCLVLAPDDVVGYLRMGDYLTGEDAANIVIGHMAGAAVAGIGPGNGPTVGPDLLVIDTAKIRPEVLPRPDTWPPRLQSRYLSAAVLELGYRTKRIDFIEPLHLPRPPGDASLYTESVARINDAYPGVLGWQMTPQGWGIA